MTMYKRRRGEAQIPAPVAVLAGGGESEGCLVWEPEPRHSCNPPIRGVDIPTAPSESIWQCNCGKFWQVQKPLRVYVGQQRHPNEWTLISKLEAKRIMRKASTEDTP